MSPAKKSPQEGIVQDAPRYRVLTEDLYYCPKRCPVDDPARDERVALHGDVIDDLPPGAVADLVADGWIEDAKKADLYRTPRGGAAEKIARTAGQLANVRGITTETTYLEVDGKVVIDRRKELEPK